MITFAKLDAPLSDDTRAAPGWAPADGEGVLFFWRCACGSWLAVSFDRFQVEDDGQVLPALHHADPACNFHEVVRLADWSPVYE